MISYIQFRFGFMYERVKSDSSVASFCKAAKECESEGRREQGHSRSLVLSSSPPPSLLSLSLSLARNSWAGLAGLFHDTTVRFANISLSYTMLE